MNKSLAVLAAAVRGARRHWLAPMILRPILISIVAAILVGCTRSPDAIVRLVADLASTGGMWLNGYQGIVQLPISASEKQVLTECFKKVEFRTTRQGVATNGYVTSFNILKVRQVRIPSAFDPDLYTAVLARTDLGDKIILLRPGNGWWWRAFDADGHYGRIELPPLQKAAAEMNFAAVESLLNQRADVNAKTFNGMTALHFAAMSGQTNILKLLLAHQAKVNVATTNEGWTPLHFAAMFGHKEAIQLLLDNKADINATARSGGATPLQEAVHDRMTDKDVVELLLTNGADVNVRDQLRETLLHYATERGNKAVAEVLLAHHAEVNATNIYGETPLHLALAWNKEDVADLLRQHGGKE